MRDVTIGIDASNLRSGGGLTHISSILSHLETPPAPIRHIHVWGCAATLDRLPERPWLSRHHWPELDAGLPSRLRWQQWRLPLLLQEFGCDVLLSPGGVLPVGLDIPGVVLSQNMLPFEPREARRYPLLSGMRLRLAALSLFQRHSMRHAQGIVFLSRYAQESIVSGLGGRVSKTARIPHGIQERFFCPPRPQQALSDINRPFRLLYVSIIDVYKHQWHVAKAIHKLRQKGLLLEIQFVGPAYPTALARFKRALGSLDPKGEYLRYIGMIPYEELHEIYHRADAFVFASSCENQPIILLEAMAAGLPIACSHSGPMWEVLGEAGVYFHPEAPDSIAGGVERLVKDHRLRERLARLAYTESHTYSWESCAQKTFEFVVQCAEVGERHALRAGQIAEMQASVASP